MAATRSPAELARNLSHWAVTRGWCGTDPYDALNSSRRLTRPLTRTALGRRILIQAVKRCPLDLRPALGIRPGVDAATLALAVSAHARGSFLTAAEHAATLRGALRALEGLRSAGYKEACWGYHFPFQSRVFFYARGEPNTIATAFAGMALLDAHRATGEEEPLEMASGRRPVLRPPRTPDGVRAGRVLWLPGGRSLADPQLEPPRGGASRPSQRARRGRHRLRRPGRGGHPVQHDAPAPGRILALRGASQPPVGGRLPHRLRPRRPAGLRGRRRGDRRGGGSLGVAGSAFTTASCSSPMGLRSTAAGASCRSTPSASRRGSRLSRSRLAATRRTRSQARGDLRLRAAPDAVRRGPADLPAPPTLGKQAVAHALVGRPDAARARAPDRARGARAVRARSRAVGVA